MLSSARQTESVGGSRSPTPTASNNGSSSPPPGMFEPTSPKLQDTFRSDRSDKGELQRQDTANAPYGKVGTTMSPSQSLRHRKQSFHVNVPHHFHPIGDHRRGSLSRVNFEIELDEIQDELSAQEDKSDTQSVDINIDPQGPVVAPPVHERPDFIYLICCACVLTMAAGYLNAVAVLEADSTATHASGSTTKFARDLVKGNWDDMVSNVVIIFPFVIGATVSGVGVGSDKFVMGHRYGVFLVFIGLLFATGTVLLRETGYTNLGIAFWAGASGMQNAMCTSFSGAVIRTTHVTGMVTDIGNVMGHWIRKQVFGPGDNAPDTWKLRVLFPQYISFFLGGIFGTLAQDAMGIDSGFIVSGLMVLLGVIYIIFASMGTFDNFLEEEEIEHEMEAVEQQFHAALHTAYHKTEVDHHSPMGDTHGPGHGHHHTFSGLHAHVQSRTESHHSTHSMHRMDSRGEMRGEMTPRNNNGGSHTVIKAAE